MQIILLGTRDAHLILQSTVSRKKADKYITAHNRIGEKERKIQRARKKAIAMAIRMFLSYQEKRVTREAFGKFLKKNREILEKISGTYDARRGIYCRDSARGTKFPFPGDQNLKMPPRESLGSINYISIQFIKIMDSECKDTASTDNLFLRMPQNGYQSDLLALKINAGDDTLPLCLC